MPSSGSVFGDLFGGKPAQTSHALTLHDITIAHTSSALQPVGDTDIEMVTPEKCIVKASAWLFYMYSELQREIVHLGNIILELRRQEQNPRHIAPNICDANELALQYQPQLYGCDSQKLRDAVREDYLQIGRAHV